MTGLHMCAWFGGRTSGSVQPTRSPIILYQRAFSFRVEPAVADWLPHSPVRAQLRHTVLQARISLRSYL